MPLPLSTLFAIRLMQVHHNKVDPPLHLLTTTTITIITPSTPMHLIITITT